MRARPFLALALTALLLPLAACGDKAPPSGGGTTAGPTQAAQPGSDDATAKGLMTFLQAVIASPDKRAALSATLRPTKADLEALFDAELAAAAEATYGPAWDNGELVLGPKKPEQTEVQLTAATVEDIQAWRGDAAAKFAGGWKKVAPHLAPGHTFYSAKLVVPGEDLGMRFDGFVHLNGGWRIVPAPWRLLKDN